MRKRLPEILFGLLAVPQSRVALPLKLLEGCHLALPVETFDKSLAVGAQVAQGILIPFQLHRQRRGAPKQRAIAGI